MHRLLLTCLAALVIARGAAAQPNIVFIFSDDHACQAIGAYGSRINETPNIDRLAREGAVFRNSFCGNSICAPSRATVLTGKHSHANGLRTNGDRFDPAQTTFPKLLQAAGYQTALIGKWHLKTEPQGFDHWETLPGQGNYYNPVLVTAEGRSQVEGYVTDIITDHALSWLGSRDPERPFLLMCQHKAPHRNWSPAPRHLSLYADREIPVPTTLFDDYAGRSAALARNEMSISGHFYWDYDLKVPGSGLPEPFGKPMSNGEYKRMTPAQRELWDAAYGPRNAAFLESRLEGRHLILWKYRRYLSDYLGTIAAVDESVGRILDYLDAEDLGGNTIVVYASDQGFYLGEHGWYDKRWMFEESLRMPLLVRWPGVLGAGAKIDALVQNIDYAPTFLEAAGVDIPEDLHGRSLVPLLRGTPATPPWRDAVYYTYYEEGIHNVPPHEGVRTATHKLIYLPKTREWQLFDLTTDPDELTSLHADPASEKLLADMQARLLALRKQYDAAPWPLPE